MNFSRWLLLHYYITNVAAITAASSMECSRELSRQVRKTLTQDLYPHLSISPEGLPVDCELNPLIEKFRIQEKQKLEMGMTEWQV